jgi:hypothetical protein
MKEENCLIGNPAKCEIITDEEKVLEKLMHIAPAIKAIKSYDPLLLGAPIGGMQSVDQALIDKLHELRRLSGRLVHLNARDALFLLKNCFVIPKLS